MDNQTMERPISAPAADVDADVQLIPNLLDDWDCAIIRRQFEHAAAGGFDPGDWPLGEWGLSDSDKMNVVYDSKRSPGMRYCYLSTSSQHSIHYKVARRLSSWMMDGYSCWDLGINKHCLPIFSYGEGAAVKPHRDRDMQSDGIITKIVVVALTEHHKDYVNGTLFLHRGVTSEDGKEVLKGEAGNRKHYTIPRGWGLLFDNQEWIHGTTPADSVYGKCCRMTCSWRLREHDIQGAL